VPNAPSSIVWLNVIKLSMSVPMNPAYADCRLMKDEDRVSPAFPTIGRHTPMINSTPASGNVAITSVGCGRGRGSAHSAQRTSSAFFLPGSAEMIFSCEHTWQVHLRSASDALGRSKAAMRAGGGPAGLAGNKKSQDFLNLNL
jgi:hypothetical protein